MGFVPKPARQVGAAPLPEPSQPPLNGAVLRTTPNNRFVYISTICKLFS